MQINTTELKQFELKLMRQAPIGLKIAQRETMNDLAFKNRKLAVDQINKTFTTRNAWTTSGKNLNVTRATRNNNYAEVGSLLNYMAQQEDGFTQKADRNTGSVAIATPVASGERTGGAVGKTLRKKAVRKPNRKNMMKQPSNKMKAVPRRQRNAALIQEAIKTKRRYIEIERNGETNIFKVTGTKKKYKLNRMYKTEHKNLIIKPHPWLAPSTKETYKSVDAMYKKRLDFQVKRMMR